MRREFDLRFLRDKVADETTSGAVAETTPKSPATPAEENAGEPVAARSTRDFSWDALLTKQESAKSRLTRIARECAEADANSFRLVDDVVIKTASVHSREDRKVVSIALSTNYGLLWETEFGLLQMLRAIDEPVVAAIVEKYPQFAMDLLAGAKATMLFQRVFAGVIFRNPFARDAKEVAPRNDGFNTYFVDVEFSEKAIAFMETLKRGVDVESMASVRK